MSTRPASATPTRRHARTTSPARARTLPPVPAQRRPAPDALSTLQGVAANLSLAQCARLLTGLLWLGWADWWLHQPGVAGAPLAAVLVAGAATAVLGASVVVRDAAMQRRLDAVLVAGTVLIVLVAGTASGMQTGYGTDELAFGQYAAARLLNGVNPYTVDLTASLQQYGVSGGGTLTLGGTFVHQLSYPALSFLAYAPAVALLGEHSYAALLMDLAAWAAAGGLLWKLMSVALRPWVPILLGVPVLFVAVVTGTNDSLYIPFELLAVCCWDRFGDPRERSVARWIGPVALGLACGLKQQPWLIAPFLLMGVAVEAHARGQDWRRVVGRYVGVAGAVFAAPNIPFIVIDPGAWLSGVLTPVASHIVPAGVGPASLLRAYSIGGGNLVLFAVAAGTALLAALALFARHYRTLRGLVPVLPLAALFVSSRSYGSYLAFAVPAIAVAAASLRPGADLPLGAGLRRLLSLAGSALAAATLVSVALALSVPAPARVAVTSSHVDQGTLTALVTVDNTSAQSISPHFILDKDTTLQQPMQAVGGPQSLAPYSSATYTLTAPGMVLTPRQGEAFQVQVSTLAPDTIASSAPATVGGP